jgi:hypothetical protein
MGGPLECEGPVPPLQSQEKHNPILKGLIRREDRTKQFKKGISFVTQVKGNSFVTQVKGNSFVTHFKGDSFVTQVKGDSFVTHFKGDKGLFS